MKPQRPNTLTGENLRNRPLPTGEAIAAKMQENLPAPGESSNSPLPGETFPMPALDPNDLKIIHRQEGAVLAFEIMAQSAIFQKADLLKKMYQDKNFKKLGYTSWEDYCSNELHMQKSKAQDMLSILKHIEPIIYAQLTALGLSQKHIKFLAQNTDDITVTVDTLAINGKAIPLAIENLPTIQKEIKAMENEIKAVKGLEDEARKDREAIEKKYEILKRNTDNALELYKMKLDEIKIRVETSFKPLKDLSKEASTDETKVKIFEEFIHNLDNFVLEMKSELLGEDVE